MLRDALSGQPAMWRTTGSGQRALAYHVALHSQHPYLDPDSFQDHLYLSSSFLSFNNKTKQQGTVDSGTATDEEHLRNKKDFTESIELGACFKFCHHSRKNRAEVHYDLVDFCLY